MAAHNETGQRGEELARKHLETDSYKILESNWKAGKAEVDIIAMDGETLVFAEVKTRRDDFFGKPETGVSLKKQQLVAEAAATFMREINHEWAIRFDVIAVLLKDVSRPEINHFKDAFFPELQKYA